MFVKEEPDRKKKKWENNTSMLKLSLCDYSEGYILVSGTISVADISDAGAAASNANKRVIFKNCTPLIDWISEINSPQVDNTKDIDRYSNADV